MSSARTAVLCVAVCAALAGPAALAGGCGDRAAAPVVAPSDVHLATEGAAWPGAAPAGTLEAVRTVALYCALVDRGQLARAAEFCTRRRLGSRRALAGVTGFRFRSARVYAAPDARTLVLKARVRVRAGRGCPLPDGLAVLFFTLGRAGTAVGGWLITAVSTSP
jgi:hypothetical protein